MNGMLIPFERLRAIQAGEIPAPTPEEIEAEEAANQAQINERRDRTRQYKRDWARQNRERTRAEIPAPTPEEIEALEAAKQAQIIEKRERNRQYQRDWARRKSERIRNQKADTTA